MAGGRRVLLTADEFHASLAAVRGLRAGGYVPIVAVSDGGSYAAASRYVRELIRVPSAEDMPERFTYAIAEAARDRDVAAVLPATEASLIALARHRSAIDVPLGAPPPDTVALATDKSRVLKLAAECGLAAPAAVTGPSAELMDRADEIGYPAILKPHRSRVELADHRLVLFRARRIDSAEALRNALRELPDVGWVVQPFVVGELSAIAGVAWHGRLVTAVHQRSPRIWPPGVGISCYAVTVPPDLVLEARIGELLSAIGWSGIFQLQLIRPPTGPPRLIDFNPRAYGSLALAVGAGANLPAVWAALVLGDPPPPASYRSGVHYRLETDDARAVLALVRSRQLRAATSAALPRRRTVHAIMSVRDPGPALVAAGRALVKLGR